MTGQYITSKEAQERLKLSRGVIEALIQNGEIRAFKVGGARNSPYRIDAASVAEYIKRQTVVPAT